MAEGKKYQISISVNTTYLADQSDPSADRYVFAYTITIANSGTVAAQLISRHWIIIDAHGRREDVQGPGVVGQTPRLLPGQAFKYQSFCPLPTPWGTMEGFYTFQRDDGETFDVAIGRFYLVQNRPADPDHL